MPRLKATLFGRFEAECEDRQKIEGIEANKVKELLGYLLVTRDRPQPREALAELLWPDQPPEQTRKNLRQTLWKLRSALDQCAPQEPPAFVVDDGWIQVNPAVWWLDVAEFEQVFGAVQNHRARELGPEEFASMQRTDGLVRGELFEGWYKDWCLLERERLQAMYLMLLHKMIQYCELHQIYDAGLAYGEKLLHYDRAYERAHREMMRLYYFSGDRTRALRQFERCVAALRDELAIAPAARTVELYEQIRADRLRPPASTASRPAASLSNQTGHPAKPLVRFVDQLRDFPASTGSEPGLLDDSLPAK